MLNALSRRRYGRGFAELLAGEPEKALRLLSEVYGPEKARSLVERLVSYAVAEAAGTGPEEARALLPGQPAALVSRGELAATLSCMVAVEEAAARVYEGLGRCLSGAAGGALPLLCGYISRESLNHAETLRGIARLLGAEAAPASCPRTGRDLVERLEEAAGLLARRCPGPGEAVEILGRLAATENMVGEEEYTRLLVPALAAALGPRGGPLRLLLEAVVSDEAWHQRLAEECIRQLKTRAGRETGPVQGV